MKKFIFVLVSALVLLLIPFTGCSDKKIEYILIDETSKYTSVYETGAPLDVSGLKIKLYTKDDLVIKSIPVSENMVTGFNKNISGTQTLTIKYGEFSTNFTITNILTPYKLIVNFSDSKGYKVRYKIGEKLDLSSMLLQLINKYDRLVESVEAVEEMITGFDSSKVGDIITIATYKGFQTTILFVIEE